MEFGSHQQIGSKSNNCSFAVKREHDCLECSDHLSPAKKNKAKSDHNLTLVDNFCQVEKCDRVEQMLWSKAPFSKKAEAEEDDLSSDDKRNENEYLHQRDVGSKQILQNRSSNPKTGGSHSWNKSLIQSVTRDDHYSNVNDSIKDNNGHCFNYLSHGMCEQLNCKFRHCFPSYKKGDEFLSVLKGFCDLKWLNVSFKHAHNHIEEENSLVQAEAVLVLLETCISMKEESFLKCVMDFVKPDILNQSFCSKFIIKCRKEPSISRCAYLPMFSFCEHKKIPLTEEAYVALLEMFENQGNDWSKILSVMVHIHLICRQTIPLVIFEKTLRAVNETRKPNLVEKMRSLMLMLDGQYLSRIDSTQVSVFLKQATNQTCADSSIDNCNLMVEGVDQSLDIDEKALNELIKNYVALDSWLRVVEYFQDFFIQGRPGDIIEEIQCAILSHGVHLGDKYAKFIREVAGGGETDLSRKVLVGQLGVALMLEAHKNRYMEAAFVILEAMHSYGINYIELQQQELSDAQYSKCDVKVCITSSWVTLVAVDVCTEVDEPEAAVQILKDTSWANPSDSLDKAVRDRELSYRVCVLMKLSEVLLKDNYELGVQVMDVLLTSVIVDLKKEICSSIVAEIDEMYTSYLIIVLNERNDSLCAILGKHLDHLRYILNIKPNILRSMVILLFESNLDISISVFSQGMLKRVYPFGMPSQLASTLTLKLPCYLALSEFCLFITLYMDTLFKLIEQRRTLNCKQNFPEIIILLKKIELEKQEPYLAFVYELASSVDKARKRMIRALRKIFKQFKFIVNRPQHTLHIPPDEVSTMFSKWEKARLTELNYGQAGNRDTGSGLRGSANYFVDVPSSKQMMPCEEDMQKSSSFVTEKFVPLPSAYPVSCFSLLLSSGKDVHRNSGGADSKFTT